MERILPLMARIFISAIFIMSGFGKLMDPSQAAGAIEAHGIPMAHSVAIFVGLVELVGGLLVLIGLFERWAACALLLFLVAATFMMHDFWTISDHAMRQMQQTNFMKNLAIMGGLLLLFDYGAGPLSVDEKRR